ncbi:hypothetical protein HDU76_013014 [Blyttiomyces sp. JEL0837]|nr:hypothetical protein HDU76_013014 [Blyttiomyces sp. JEL0837]
MNRNLDFDIDYELPFLTSRWREQWENDATLPPFKISPQQQPRGLTTLSARRTNLHGPGPHPPLSIITNTLPSNLISFSANNPLQTPTPSSATTPTSVISAMNLLQSTAAAAAGVSANLPPRLSGAKGNALPPYKTVICRAFMSTGKCFRADPDKCWFAHGLGELRDAMVAPVSTAPSASTLTTTVPALVGADIVSPTSTTSTCSSACSGNDHVHLFNGPGINATSVTGSFINSSSAVSASCPSTPVTRRVTISDPRVYKTEMCRFFIATGNCKFGNACSFAHGVEELRYRGGTGGGVGGNGGNGPE